MSISLERGETRVALDLMLPSKQQSEKLQVGLYLPQQINGFHGLKFSESMSCVGMSPLYEEKLVMNCSRNSK